MMDFKGEVGIDCEECCCCCCCSCCRTPRGLLDLDLPRAGLRGDIALVNGVNELFVAVIFFGELKTASVGEGVDTTSVLDTINGLDCMT